MEESETVLRDLLSGVYTARLRMLPGCRRKTALADASPKWRSPISSSPYQSRSRAAFRKGSWKTSALLAIGLSLASCSTGGPEGNTQGGFGRDGVVRIGYANEAPFAYYDNETDKVVGESVEVTRHILKKMGVSDFEGVLTEFVSLIPGLKAGRFDVIAAGMWIIPPRCREINFSEPISCIDQGFIVKAGNPLDLHGYEDVVRRAEARLAVVSGGVELRFARAVGLPPDRISIFPDAPSAIAGLQAGRVDALAGPVPAHKDMLSKANDPDLERVRPFNSPNIPGEPTHLCSGIGFRKDDVKFLEEFDRHLKKFVGTDQHLEMIEAFGFTETELPTGVSREDLCRPLQP